MNIETDFAAKTRAMLDQHGATLLSLAKASIQYGLEHKRPLTPDLETLPPELGAPGGCFVTLNKSGRLRGCIGSPEAHQPLATDVAQNAFRAAFQDPRFKPVQAFEAEQLDLHLSVLSPKHPMSFTDEADLLGQLHVGEDGLIIADQGRRALFLPSVWRQLPSPETFVAHLKAKAGLSQDHWSESFQAWRFIAAETGADWDEIA